jgi:hypothetical protein
VHSTPLAVLDRCILSLSKRHRLGEAGRSERSTLEGYVKDALHSVGIGVISCDHARAALLG